MITLLLNFPHNKLMVKPFAVNICMASKISNISFQSQFNSLNPDQYKAVLAVSCLYP